MSKYGAGIDPDNKLKNPNRVNRFLFFMRQTDLRHNYHTVLSPPLPLPPDRPLKLFGRRAGTDNFVLRLLRLGDNLFCEGVLVGGGEGGTA